MLRAVHPVLMCSDTRRSVAFYQSLGFEPVFADRSDDPRYVGMKRDQVELHLQWHDPSEMDHPGDHPTYRILVDDVDALYSQLESAGALPETSSPFARPRDSSWGTREFHVLDPDRNGLQFYQDS